MGLIAFSASSSDITFDETDFQFFREFARRVAVAVYNASRVQALKKINEELQDAQSRRLQESKLAAIEQLASGIAHEIHNPLTIISGKAQVLLLQKDRSPLDSKVEEVLKTIVKQTKRAADITRKLLMFSQGPGSLKETVRLDQVLEDTVALISYQTSLEGIEISKNVCHPVPPFHANVHEFREIFLNLILNAVQSMDSGGKVHIEIRDHSQERFVEILISDTGKGISRLPKDSPKKFFPCLFIRS